MDAGAAQYPSLAGKAVVITGGATGIGRAIAEAFAGQRAHVAILDRDAEAGAALHAHLGEGHFFKACDVTDAPALRGAIDEAGGLWGGIDILIANAADDSRHDPDTVTPEAWDRSMAVNLDHQFFAAQAVHPWMARRGGGSIVCLGSISWLNGTTGMVAYTTAKAGIHGLARTLARLWGPERIRVNVLLPGWTMTERQRALWVAEEAEDEMDAAQALPGRILPDHIARAALFLSSDEAAMITRQTLVVDAGWT